MGKYKHSKFKSFLYISHDLEIHTIPKIWGKKSSIVRKNFGKTQTFRRYGLLTYFAWSRNPCTSKNMEKVSYHSIKKVLGNTHIPKLWVS